MSGPSISQLENTPKTELFPTISAFKSRMRHVLLNSRYVAEFGGSPFWTKYAQYVRYMISAVTLPQLAIDSEQTYVGGTIAMVPNGFQPGNLDLTIYNTGPELKIMHLWLAETYNQSSRSYGYFDDIKCDLKIMQFATNGDLVQTMTFTDCTIYNLGGMNFSYAPATEIQTFTVALNYFGYMLETENKFFDGLFNQRTMLHDETNTQNPITNTEFSVPGKHSPLAAGSIKKINADDPLKSKKNNEEENEPTVPYDDPLKSKNNEEEENEPTVPYDDPLTPNLNP